MAPDPVHGKPLHNNTGHEEKNGESLVEEIQKMTGDSIREKTSIKKVKKKKKL